MPRSIDGSASSSPIPTPASHYVELAGSNSSQSEPATRDRGVTAREDACIYADLDFVRMIATGGEVSTVAVTPSGIVMPSPVLTKSMGKFIGDAVRTFARSHRFDLRPSVTLAHHYGSRVAVNDLRRSTDSFQFETLAVGLWSDLEERNADKPRAALMAVYATLVKAMVRVAVRGLSDAQKQVFARHATRGEYLQMAINESRGSEAAKWRACRDLFGTMRQVGDELAHVGKRGRAERSALAQEVAAGPERRARAAD